jgi:chemotaxis protein methyltransferase CheR
VPNAAKKSPLRAGRKPTGRYIQPGVAAGAGLILHEVLQKDEKGYKVLSDLLRQLSGIHMPVNDKNLTLMACRLAPLFKRRGVESYQTYLNLLRTKDSQVLHEFVEALTTNTTEFFREAQHFDLFPQVLKVIMDRKRAENSQEIRAWCAAASTGQEPYTILMTLLETIPSAVSWKIKMLASDIDRAALMTASQGLYRATQLKNVNEPLLKKYFTLAENGPNPLYKVKKFLREPAVFAEFNLATVPYPFRYPFDIVFCRNVLIYFETEMGREVVNRIVNSMAVGGYLFIGHSETGMVRSSRLKMEANAVYRRVK